MYFLQYSVMCLFIGVYLYFPLTDATLPSLFFIVSTWVFWAFLLWGAFTSGRIIVDCAILSSKGQMTASNAWNGVLMAILSFLPTLGMSVFMIQEGFVGK